MFWRVDFIYIQIEDVKGDLGWPYFLDLPLPSKLSLQSLKLTASLHLQHQWVGRWDFLFRRSIFRGELLDYHCASRCNSTFAGFFSWLVFDTIDSKKQLYTYVGITSGITVSITNKWFIIYWFKSFWCLTPGECQFSIFRITPIYKPWKLPLGRGTRTGCLGDLPTIVSN